MFLNFGRLYPLHVFVLGLFLIGELAKAYGGPLAEGARVPFTDPNSPGGLYLQLSLLNAHGLYDHDTWNFPAWSIGAEFYTYLLFALVIRIAGSAIPIALAAIAIGGTGFMLLTDHVNMNVTSELGFVRAVAGFAVGALCQRARRTFSLTGISGPRMASLVEISILILVIAFVSYAGSNRMSFAAPLVFAAALLVFAAESGGVSRILQTPPFRFVGKISYSIYMVQVFVLINLSSIAGSLEQQMGIPLTTTVHYGDVTIVALGTTPWEGTLAYIPALLLVIIVATATYRWVEVPARLLSRRLAPRIKL